MLTYCPAPGTICISFFFFFFLFFFSLLKIPFFLTLSFPNPSFCCSASLRVITYAHIHSWASNYVALSS